jgi:hypothetical protein
MELQDRVKELLGKGLSGSVVASALGCDPSYVAQLMSEDEFRAAVTNMRAQGAETALKRDSKWDGLEDQMLDKLTMLVPMVTRVSDLARIAQIANNAKRTAKELANSNDTAAPTVTLVLPEAATVRFITNHSAQVVEVEGRSMAALPTKHLQTVMDERKKERLQLVHTPNTVIDVPAVQQAERKKVLSILEQIGFAEEATDVQDVLNGSHESS